jgi:hypothetical protein
MQRRPTFALLSLSLTPPAELTEASEGEDGEGLSINVLHSPPFDLIHNRRCCYAPKFNQESKYREMMAEPFFESTFALMRRISCTFTAN